MPTKLKQSLTITGDTGVTASNSGVAWDGSSPVVQEISLGQSIGTTDDVQFNSITSSLWKLGDDISISDNGQILGSVTNTGTLSVSSTLTIGGNATTTGKITAEEIIAELTSSNTIFKSGSTQFGDSIDDTHYFTGSLYDSGSFVYNGYSVNEISNDTTLAGDSATAVVTENAAKTYADSNVGTSVVEPYLRKNYNRNTSTISNNTASFTGTVTASAPAGITATSETDFLIFNNGQIMEHDALTIQQVRGTFNVIVNSTDLGYTLEDGDTIKAWGKFEPKGELKFDGSNDEVRTSFSGSSGLGTHIPVPKTYSFWAKSSQTSRNYSTFGWGDNKKSFVFNFHANRVLRWYNAGWYMYWDDTSAQDDGQWHHWMVYDSPSELSGSKLYVDGTLIPINEIVSSSGAGAANYLQNLTIGSHRNDSTGADAHFSGSIKEFSVFGGDKTSFASTYYNNGTPYDVTNETDLQAYWKMTEGGGTTVFDYSNNTDSNGNRYDGTIDGATWEAIE
jgi:hypothetical protein